MKKALILLLVLFLPIAYFTNPSMDDFTEYAGSMIEARLQGLANAQIFNWALDKVIRAGVDAVTRRRDYKLFSIYYVELPVVDYEFKYLGIFGHFLPLDKIDDRIIPGKN